MSALLDKMLKARESVVEIDGHRFTIRRPTDLEIVELQATDGGMNLRNALQFVIGWDFTELDLYKGGTDKAAEFNHEVLALWVEDNPQVWGELLQAIGAAYKAHADKREASAGN